jgi:hypothetical protein
VPLTRLHHPAVGVFCGVGCDTVAVAKTLLVKFAYVVAVFQLLELQLLLSLCHLVHILHKQGAGILIKLKSPLAYLAPDEVAIPLNLPYGGVAIHYFTSSNICSALSVRR